MRSPIPHDAEGAAKVKKEGEQKTKTPDPEGHRFPQGGNRGVYRTVQLASNRRKVLQFHADGSAVLAEIYRLDRRANLRSRYRIDSRVSLGMSDRTRPPVRLVRAFIGAWSGAK